MLTVSLSIHAVAMTTDEVETHQREQRQQAESDIETRTAVPVEEHLQPRSRHSGRGLSRLFSSLLKRRSQCESDAGDNKDEEETKAPIADPEPELRAEGEAAQDQHSVSSAEAQVSVCSCLQSIPTSSQEMIQKRLWSCGATAVVLQ